MRRWKSLAHGGKPCRPGQFGAEKQTRGVLSKRHTHQTLALLSDSIEERMRTLRG
jgi:hypothetical protein